MRMPTASRVLFAVTALVLAVGAHAADLNATHIYNPAFTPHAKFHTGQTLSFSWMLAALTIFLAWRRTSDKVGGVLATAAVASVYWTSQATAILYPGTKFFDGDGEWVFGLPVQMLIEAAELTLVAIASILALRHTAKWS